MSDSSAARHGVIVLAAGSSQRLGQAKQLLTINGETLVHRAVRLGLETDPVDCVVVSGADAEMIKASVADLDCRVVTCAGYRSGLSASMQAGLGALHSECAAALILLTDQAALDARHLSRLCEGWRSDQQRATASAYADTVGVPAILPRSWFPELAKTHGDRGARDLLRRRSSEVGVVVAPELAHDIDTAADLVDAGILKD